MLICLRLILIASLLSSLIIASNSNDLFDTFEQLKISDNDQSSSDDDDIDNINENFVESIDINPSKPTNEKEINSFIDYLKIQSQYPSSIEERWLFNLLEIEKKTTLSKEKKLAMFNLSELVSQTLKCPSKGLVSCIRHLIDSYYVMLCQKRDNSLYLIYLFRALDEYINDETAICLINTIWSSFSFPSTIAEAIAKFTFHHNFIADDEDEESTESIRPITPLKMMAKTGKTAKIFLKKKFEIDLDKEPHSSIWFFLNFIHFSNIGPHEYSRILKTLLIPKMVLTNKVSFLKLFCTKNVVHEWVKYQIDLGMFDIDPLDITLLTKDGFKTSLSISPVILWKGTALNLLKEKNNVIAMLNERIPSAAPIGSKPKYKLLELDDAIEIIKQQSISNASQMYILFILGANGSTMENQDSWLRIMEYKDHYLDNLAKWISEIWKSSFISFPQRDTLVTFQIHLPYLELVQLFPNGIFNGEYAKTIVKNDPATLELIGMAAGQNCKISKKYNYDLVFSFMNGMNWDDNVITHFRKVISRLVILNFDYWMGRVEFKESLESYLGFNFGKLTFESDHSLVDIKMGYQLCSQAYDMLTIQAEKYKMIISKENKTKVCKRVVYASYPQSTLKYYIEYLQIVLTNSGQSLMLEMDKHSCQIIQTREYYKVKRFFSEIPKENFFLLPDLFKLNEAFVGKILHLKVDYLCFVLQSDCKSLDEKKLDITRFYKVLELEKDDPFSPLILSLLNRITREYLNIDFVNKIIELFKDILCKLEMSLAIVYSLNLKHFGKEAIIKIMKNALLDDDLGLSAAFLWHLLDAHFEENVFDWKAFNQAMGMEATSIVDGKEILNQIRRTSIEKTSYFRKKFNLYHKKSSNQCIEMHEMDSNDLKYYIEEPKDFTAKPRHYYYIYKSKDFLIQFVRLFYENVK